MRSISSVTSLALLLLLTISTVSADSPATIEVRTQAAAVGTVCPPAAAVRNGGSPSDSDWSVNLHGPAGGGYPYTPTLFDVDGDGKAEIFVRGENVFGLRGDGSFLPNWPTTEQQYQGYASNGSMPGPSCADVDGDGITEILWAIRDWYAGNSNIYCFNGKKLDYTNMAHFPQRAPDDFSNVLGIPFVLGDVNGDGKIEAWTAHSLGNTFTFYRVSGFDSTGLKLFTTDLANHDDSIVCLYYGDLDGDGTKEMFAISWLSPTYYLHVFNADGTERGAPVALFTMTYGWQQTEPPVVADLDGDGQLEILLGWWDGSFSYAMGFRRDGTQIGAPFPIQIGESSQLMGLGLGDLTGDGAPELLATDHILGAGNRVFALSLNTGSMLPGWPVEINGVPKGLPTVVDVDDDGYQEFVIETDAGLVYAVKNDGSVAAGFPKTMQAASYSGVSAGDIDGDGLYELVAATTTGWVYAWKTTGRVLPHRADWPQRGVNARNTGVFGDLDPIIVRGDLNCDGQVNFDDINPFVLALSDPGGYHQQYPNCNILTGDCNGDGRVSFDDINPFVALLTPPA